MTSESTPATCGSGCDFVMIDKKIKHARRNAQATAKEERYALFRTHLLTWYQSNARVLPWRQTRDPYAIWVSEVMLQQTRVDTVVPYYAKFLERFPTVQVLADASLDRVLERWSGLGYYRRARMLHQGAQHVADVHEGEVPRTTDELKQVPGIGDYTAGAIASIAYGVKAPLVDGNVHRVLARLFGLADAEPIARKRAWLLAAELVPGGAPGDFNQALMELGATVCTPAKASCAACPVASHCEALRLGKVSSWPVPKIKKAVPVVETNAYVVVDSEGRVLLAQRPLDGRFGGLWEPPTLDEAPAWARSLQNAGRIKHILTHERMQVSVFVGKAKSRGLPMLKAYTSTAFVSNDALGKYALSKLAKKILGAAKF
jgi:A/G-specific adenine glycosylase